MQKPAKVILLAPILVLSILLFSPIAAKAAMPDFATLQILGTFSGKDVLGPELKSVFVNQPIPIDPTASMWQNAPQTKITLMGQNITIPILFNPTVTSLNVRSMNNGTWVGFMLEWADPTESLFALNTNQFRDSIAISLPTTEGKTFIAMGGPGTPVNILHWKADWQKDVDLGRYLDHQDEYPNMAYDFYVGNKTMPTGGNAFQGVVGGYNDPTNPRHPVEDVSKMYLPGYAAGNSFSTRDSPRQTPIEELVAEGFGTLTSQEHQDSLGKGVWDNGVWRVVVARSMLTMDLSDAQLQPGQTTSIAFAIWDGGNKEVDGRKAVALWHTLVIEQGVASPLVGKEPLTVPGPSEGASMMLISAIIIGVAVVAGASIFYAARRRAPSITR